MRIALGYYGFIRTSITKENVINFMNLFPTDSTFDLYFNFPNKLKEFDEDSFDKKKIIKELSEIFNVPNMNLVRINIYDYDSFTFINKSQQLNLPYHTKLIEKRWCNYPFRIMSLHYGISNLAKLILLENKEYDMVVLTRLDVFYAIKSMGVCIDKINKKNIFIWKNYEYNWMNFSLAEDVIFVSSMYGTNILSNMYNYIYEENNLYIHDLYNYEAFSSEYIITLYINRFQSLEKEPQTKLDRLKVNEIATNQVRSNSDFVITCYKILKKYNKKYNTNYFEDKIELEFE
jgi:hypothetical protein